MPQQPRVTGPFRLDVETIENIERNWQRAEMIRHAQLQPIDLSFTEPSIRIKPSNGITYPTERLHHLITQSPTRPHSANVSLYSASSPQHQMMMQQHQQHQQNRPSTAPEASPMADTPKYDPKLLSIIKNIGNPDSYVSHASLNELLDILETPEKQAVMRDYEEIYIQSVLTQFRVSCRLASHSLDSFSFNVTRFDSRFFRNAHLLKRLRSTSHSSTAFSSSSAQNRWDRI